MDSFDRFDDTTSRSEKARRQEQVSVPKNLGVAVSLPVRKHGLIQTQPFKANHGPAGSLEARMRHARAIAAWNRDENRFHPRTRWERICHRQPESWQLPLHTASKPPLHRRNIYFSFRVEFSSYKVMGFAGDCVLVSFKGNCVRGARFSRSRDPPFWETPEPMTTFAVSFMRNKAKN